MKKVSLFVVFLLTWASLTVFDAPKVTALPHADMPPPGEIRSGGEGGETTDGDPDDIIEGNRRQGIKGPEEPNGPPQEVIRDLEVWQRVLQQLRMLIWI